MSNISSDICLRRLRNGIQWLGRLKYGQSWCKDNGRALYQKLHFQYTQIIECKAWEMQLSVEKL